MSGKSSKKLRREVRKVVNGNIRSDMQKQQIFIKNLQSMKLKDRIKFGLKIIFRRY